MRVSSPQSTLEIQIRKLNLPPGGCCSGQRACEHAQLGAPRHGTGYHQLSCKATPLTHKSRVTVSSAGCRGRTLEEVGEATAASAEGWAGWVAAAARGEAVAGWAVAVAEAAAAAAAAGCPGGRAAARRHPPRKAGRRGSPRARRGSRGRPRRSAPTSLTGRPFCRRCRLRPPRSPHASPRTCVAASPHPQPSTRPSSPNTHPPASFFSTRPPSILPRLYALPTLYPLHIRWLWVNRHESNVNTTARTHSLRRRNDSRHRTGRWKCTTGAASRWTPRCWSLWRCPASPPCVRKTPGPRCRKTPPRRVGSPRCPPALCAREQERVNDTVRGRERESTLTPSPWLASTPVPAAPSLHLLIENRWATDLTAGGPT
jgi:hypothetical protein